MWLGPSFWELTGADKGKLEDIDWLQRSEQTHNVIKIKAAESCFATDEGELGKRQLQLRSVLFPHPVLDRFGKSHSTTSATRH